MEAVGGLFPTGQPRPSYQCAPSALLLDGLGEVSLHLSGVADPVRYLRELASASSALAAELEGSASVPSQLASS